MQKNFVVYKSSAGSGKTFILVKNYLKIALSDKGKSPQLFKKILAITFTNKAAAEMKQRIVDALIVMSAGKASVLSDILAKELSIEMPVLQERAGVLLSRILHNYSDFAVGTIDSFTHKIIKTFAFDLKLPVNFNVETNSDEFYEKVINHLFSKIGENKDMTELLVNFSVKNADDNASWDPEPQLQKISKELKKEDAELYLNKLKTLDNNQFKKIHKTISSFTYNLKKYVKSQGEKAINLIKSKHLTDANFHYGTSGPQSSFKKWADFNESDLTKLIGARLNDALSTNNWKNKTNDTSENKALEEIIPELNTIAKETIEFIKENHSRYTLYKLIEKHIHGIILINELQQISEKFKEEEQIVFISEFNSKIAGIVANEPTPFIYERLGEKYHYYLIDEFQDTSSLQWHNILPLIDNSLSGGNYNLIVGDGKQSIYRWRNANVKQFNQLPEISGAKENAILEERQNSLIKQYREEILGINYRSFSEVVDFNNRFFEFLPNKVLSESLSDVYKNQKQEKNTKTGGYVTIEMENIEKENLESTHLDQLLKHIKNAIESGFSYNDICVITRNNKQGNLISCFLDKNKIPFISSESLLLYKSPEINCISAFLNYLINPKDQISAAVVLSYIHKTRKLKNNLSEVIKLSKEKNLFEALNDLNICINETEIKRKNIFDCCVELISILEMEKRNSQYVRFFLDEIHDYLVNKAGTINDFLVWWAKRKDNASVIIPEGAEAVQIMTIHKSKGLEFPVVILPFLNWTISKEEYIWANIDDSGIDLPVGLFPTNKKIEEAGLGNVLNEEENDKKLDNLNLLYVAFTRAVERLHIIASKAITNKKTTIDSWVKLFLKETKNDNKDGFYEFGIPEAKKSRSEKNKNEVFDLDFIQFNSNQNLIQIKGAHKLKLNEQTELAREKGVKLHYILSQINIKNDIKPILSKMLKQGLVSSPEADEFGTKINELLENNLIKQYYEGVYDIKNESEILTETGEILRPDKIIFTPEEAVVIDYKTGKQNTKNHVPQMLKYQNALMNMGYGKIKKILVYVEENFIEVLS